MALPKPQPRLKSPAARNVLHGAQAPANGFGRPPRGSNLNSRTAIVAVPDANDAGERTLATVNRCVDILEVERSANPPRITEAAYLTARQVLATFEPRTAVGSSNWLNETRADPYTAKELAVIHRLDAARRVNALILWLRHELGRIDANLVVRILGEGKSYAEVAALQGKSGERGISYIAQRFRDALESLAEAKAARGEPCPSLRAESYAAKASEA